MNLQTIIGTLLISSAIALASMFFRPAFNMNPPQMDQPSVRTRVAESPLRFHREVPAPVLYRPTAIVTTQQRLPRMRPPLIAPQPLPAKPAPAPVLEIVDQSSDHEDVVHVDSFQFDPVEADSIEINSIQARQIQIDLDHQQSSYETSSYETSSQANVTNQDLLPQDRLPERNDESDTVRVEAASNAAQQYSFSPPNQTKQLSQATSVTSPIRQEVKTRLEERYSTDRPKYVSNRYVTSGGQPTSASEVVALKKDLRQKSRTETAAVQQASYESKGSALESSVLIEEPIFSGPSAGSAIAPAVQRPRSPQQIAPANNALGQSTQPPVLQRQRTNPQVEPRAREHIEYGQSLARRNSYLAAREEFTLALILIARSHKTQADPEAYSDVLAQGLTALDEAADLVGPNQEWSQQSLLQQKVLSHKTRLISPTEIGKVSRTQVLDRYCGFAQSQIEQAVGRSAAGSAALHALGKIETRSSVNSQRGDWTGQARALVFFRAAMTCNPTNAACSNDLGVLLNDMGRLVEAEHAFNAALKSSPTRSAWANLAAVYSQLATNSQVAQERSRYLHHARIAAMRAQQSGNNIAAGGGAGDQWATPNEFHSNAAFPNVTTQTVSQGRQRNSSQGNVSPARTLLEKVKRW